MYAKKLFFSLMATLLSMGVYAQDEKGSWTIATNPSYFVVGGYSARGYYHFPKKWSIGLQLEGIDEIPDFSRDQFFDISESATVDWDFLVGTQVRYRFTDSEIDKGLYLSGAFGYEGWRIKDSGNTDEFTNWYASVGVGYNWYPFEKKRLHFGAAYSLIFILNNTDNRSIGEGQYSINSVVPPSIIPTLFVGWRF